MHKLLIKINKLKIIKYMGLEITKFCDCRESRDYINSEEVR